MNYIPFCGYWFYGGASSEEMACYFTSWGLLGVLEESQILTLLRIPNMPFHAFIPTIGEV